MERKVRKKKSNFLQLSTRCGFCCLAPSPVLGVTTVLYFHAGPHHSCGTDPILCSKVGHRLGSGQSEPRIPPAPMTLPKDGQETQ